MSAIQTSPVGTRDECNVAGTSSPPRRGRPGTLIIVHPNEQGELTRAALANVETRLRSATARIRGGDVMVDLSCLPRVPQRLFQAIAWFDQQLRAQHRSLIVVGDRHVSVEDEQE